MAWPQQSNINNDNKKEKTRKTSDRCITGQTRLVAVPSTVIVLITGLWSPQLPTSPQIPQMHTEDVEVFQQPTAYGADAHARGHGTLLCGCAGRMFGAHPRRVCSKIQRCLYVGSVMKYQ
jgi:hypothetical protein